MIGKTISHYRVLERLGAGGMGEVYKAEDLRLRRQVALKLLRDDGQKSDSHGDESKKRFLREAQAAAALNHPNIATIYEIDQFMLDGEERSFIAMELVGGRALSEYARIRTISVNEAIEIVLQIAAALEAAHHRGIVHRDVKPSNVMITENRRVKTLDFGLAKFVQNEQSGQRAENDDTSSDLNSESLRTTPGLVMGTAAYMSPEQALGQDVDHRSDIFSLGALFYELLAGRLPFTGETAMAMVTKIIHAEPQPVNSHNPQVTPELDRIVRKMLAKDRDARYQQMREVILDLEANRNARRYYEFGPFRLDVTERLLTRDGETVDLKPKVFDLLVLMAQNRGRLMTKDEIFRALWPDTVVEEANLNVNISALRKVLGDTASDPKFIETVPKRGYRFVAEVREITEKPVEKAQVVHPLQQAQSGKSGAMPIAAPGNSAATTEDLLPVSTDEAREQVGLRRPAVWLMAVALLLTVAIAVGIFVWMQSRSWVARNHTIAVLPFKSLKAGDSDQVLALGMADTLITRLSGIRNLTVRPTSAVLKYSGSDADPVAAGREMAVDFVLEGRVQRDEKMIRVTAQLIKVADGSSLWAGKFDDFFTNVFAVQDSISEKLAGALSMQLTSAEQRQLARRHTENTEAYQLFLEGRFFYFKYEFRRSLGYFQAAVDKDPEYSLAWAELASNYVALAVTTPERREMRDKAIEAAEKALKLEPNLVEAHSAIGWIKFLGDWDWAGAEASLRRAIEINPNHPEPRTNLSALLSVLGHFDESLQESETAIQLDPASTEYILQYAYNLLAARRYDQALEQIKKALEMEPGTVHLGSLLSRIYSIKSMYEQAITEFRKYPGAERTNKVSTLAYAYARLGKRVEAEEVLKGFLQRAGATGVNIEIARIYAGLNERDRALEWLEKAYQARDNQMIHLKVDPEWDSLRFDARFKDLLRRMKLAP
jgi:DNA-binding winged helix-turn-helix (wHTH) protein/TolB-like protein/Flp pilus assembly protein TadD